MRRPLLLCLLSAAILFDPLTPARASAPIVAEWQIDSIVLIAVPSYGSMDELTRNETIIRPHVGTVRTQTIRLKDETVQEQRLFAANSEDLAALVSSLYAFGFFGMPEYLGTNIMDGTYTWITVHTVSGEAIRVGDIHAEEYGPEGFIAVYDAIGQVMRGAVEYGAHAGPSAALYAASLRLGEETSIVENENPTTPYRLLLVLTDETVMELAGDEYIQDFNPFGADGVGGKHHYRLRAVGVGECAADLYRVYIGDNIDRAEYRDTYLFTVTE